MPYVLQSFWKPLDALQLSKVSLQACTHAAVGWIKLHSHKDTEDAHSSASGEVPVQGSFRTLTYLRHMTWIEHFVKTV